MFNLRNNCIGFISTKAGPPDPEYYMDACECSTSVPIDFDCECSPVQKCESCDLEMATAAGLVQKCDVCDTFTSTDDPCVACTRYEQMSEDQWYNAENHDCYIRALTGMMVQKYEGEHEEYETEQMYEEAYEEFVRATDKYAPEGLKSYRDSNFLKAMRIVKHVYQKNNLVRVRANATIKDILESYSCAILELRYSESGSANHYTVVVQNYYDQGMVYVDKSDYFGYGNIENPCQDCHEGWQCIGEIFIRDIWVFADEAKQM